MDSTNLPRSILAADLSFRTVVNAFMLSLLDCSVGTRPMSRARWWPKLFVTKGAFYWRVLYQFADPG